MDEKAICDMLGWDHQIYPVAHLPIAYPVESSSLGKRQPMEDLLID